MVQAVHSSLNTHWTPITKFYCVFVKSLCSQITIQSALKEFCIVLVGRLCNIDCKYLIDLELFVLSFDSNKKESSNVKKKIQCLLIVVHFLLISIKICVQNRNFSLINLRFFSCNNNRLLKRNDSKNWFKSVFINDAHQDLLPLADGIGMEMRIKIKMQNTQISISKIKCKIESFYLRVNENCTVLCASYNFHPANQPANHSFESLSSNNDFMFYACKFLESSIASTACVRSYISFCFLFFFKVWLDHIGLASNENEQLKCLYRFEWDGNRNSQ